MALQFLSVALNIDPEEIFSAEKRMISRYSRKECIQRKVNSPPRLPLEPASHPGQHCTHVYCQTEWSA